MWGMVKRIGQVNGEKIVNFWKTIGFVSLLVAGRVDLLKSHWCCKVLGLQIYSGRARTHRERSLDLPAVRESKMCGEW